MIDIHSHILFGVDDGAGNAEDSLIMAEMAAENGVKQMIMTPHCCEADGFANFNTAELTARFDSMRAMMKENEIPLKLYNGMEVFSTPRLGEQIDEGKLITLAGSKYLLIEFAFGETDEFMERSLQTVFERGLIPVIAHPERYYFIQDEPAFLEHCALCGAVVQLNKGSLTGMFGRHAKKTARWCLEHGCVHVIASDAHGPYRRTTKLNDGYDVVAEYYGQDAAELLFCENPAAIINNGEVYALASEF